MTIQPPANAVDILARTLWGEARGEGKVGMQAVANVVMNRVAKPGWWGQGIISVCLKPKQFSCWNGDDPNLPKVQAVTTDDSAFVTALEIANEAVAGTLADITMGATSYKENVLPWPSAWGTQVDPLVVIGNHSFYNLA